MFEIKLYYFSFMVLLFCLLFSLSFICKRVNLSQHKQPCMNALLCPIFTESSHNNALYMVANNWCYIFMFVMLERGKLKVSYK